MMIKSFMICTVPIFFFFYWLYTMPNTKNNSASLVKKTTKKVIKKIKTSVNKVESAVNRVASANLNAVVNSANNRNPALNNNKTLKKNVNKLKNTAKTVIHKRVHKVAQNVQAKLAKQAPNAVKAAIVNNNPRPLERLGMAMESAGGLMGAAVRLPFNIVQRGLNAATGTKRNYGTHKGVFGHARNMVSHTGYGVTGLVAAPFRLFSRNTNRNNNRRKH